MNVKKIAEEIFQSPTQEELFRRAIEDESFLDRSQYVASFARPPFFVSNFSEEEAYRLFPNGAYCVTDRDWEYGTVGRKTFDMVQHYFDATVKNWQKINWKQDLSVKQWHKAKLNGKTVMKAYEPGDFTGYWFEEGIA